MTNDTWRHMREHLHQVISSSPNVKQGDTHQPWAYGDMVSKGAHVPQGGQLGDAYTSYSYMSVSEVKDIDVMFNHAEVDTL
jgi:hypothetical protein